MKGEKKNSTLNIYAFLQNMFHTMLHSIANMSNINRNFVYSHAKIIIILEVSKYKSIHVL